MIRARKSLGQNFLVDPGLQRRIVEALDPGPADDVLEIGPGAGALTRHLAGRVHHLTAIEKDAALAERLSAELAEIDGVTILNRDALSTDPRIAGDPERLKVIGNIPYNITTPLLFHLLAPDCRPERIVVMVQREVAERILAEPGSRAYGALSVGVRSVASVEPLMRAGPAAFRPRPAVESVVLRITPHRPPPMDPAEEQDLRTLTRAAFSWRRKQLGRTLRSAPGYQIVEADAIRVLDSIGARPDARAETLAPAQFIALTRALRARGFPTRPS